MEESRKVSKLQVSQPEDEQREIVRCLQSENKELKEALGRSKGLYETLMHCEKREDYSKRVSLETQRYELAQREEKLRKGLERAVR